MSCETCRYSAMRGYDSGLYCEWEAPQSLLEALNLLSLNRAAVHPDWSCSQYKERTNERWPRLR
jgi:hypothetical protein